MPALTYQSAYDGAVADANLAHRVEVGVVQAAREIFTAESATPSKRTALATAVLNGPAMLIHTWVLICATDPTIVAAGVLPTDAQILAAVKAAWSAVAGT